MNPIACYNKYGWSINVLSDDIGNYIIPKSFLTKGIINNIESSIKKKLTDKYNKLHSKISKIDSNFINEYTESLFEKVDKLPINFDDDVFQIVLLELGDGADKGESNARFIRSVKSSGFVSKKQFKVFVTIFQTWRRAYLPRKSYYNTLEDDTHLNFYGDPQDI